MLEIKYALYEKEIDKRIISERGTYLVSLIEGELKIYFDSILFFDEPYINLLELSVQLYKWVRKISKNKFIYESMENEEPILIFEEIRNGYWQIDSIWKRTDSSEIGKKELYKNIKWFIESIDIELKAKYNIKTIDIINANKYRG